jgi:hypothetical protein
LEVVAAPVEPDSDVSRVHETETQAQMNRRDEVARIIDPETFDLIEHYNALPCGSGEESTFRAYPQLKERRDTAYAKADAILALIT